MSLSDVEIAVVMSTWKIPMGNPEESGKVILMRFFERHPDYKKYFADFQNKSLEELKEEPKFKAHAGRIVRAFDNAIKSAEERGAEAALSKEKWNTLATSHSKRQIPKQAFLDLKVIMLEVLNEVCKLNDFQKKSWEKLLDNLYGIMIEKLTALGK